ncbi:endoplasmic reticulum-based factor for assembly of V-ATPase-domain-containing protein [Jimgerdemannia flammicorona]|uniref:Endoplasmic reticulum-based factor for assembly of V-ATPase-domain-containing protein n=1 Tax=Jimgerdemannia flammicorona TaxID=994334 RepID=A0A433DC99_9FUNG|nr:endoplasmic reticulum-based factor for assembly of V-ATPase-domain-containing protein [Jimgerdemannia flammicorona]
MVLLILTERIRHAIQTAIACPEFDVSVKDRLLPFLRGEVKVPTMPALSTAPYPTEGNFVVEGNVADGVPLELVKEVSSFLVSREAKMGNEIGLSHYWLHELLVGSTVYTHPQPVRMKSPMLLNRIETILTDQSNAEYNRMIGDVFSESPTDMHYFFQVNRGDVRELRAHLSAIVNATFTIVAVFVAIYAVSKTITNDIGMRVLLGLIGALVVAVAEAWLYMRHVAANKPPKTIRRRRSSRMSTKRRSVVIPNEQSISMPQ